MMRRVAATAVVPRRSSSNCVGGGGCHATTNLSATIKTKTRTTTVNNTNIRTAKRYMSSDDYSKIGASVPVGSSRGGSVRSNINGHGSQFVTLSIPLVLVSAYFAMFPSDKEQVEEAIREKYENEINEISTANTIMDQYGAPNSAKALEREKNLELFYKHTIKGMGKNTTEKASNVASIQNDEERANVIEMEQRLQSVLLGGKEEGALDQNIVAKGTSEETPAVINAKAIAKDATAIVSKNALIDDGKSRNPYSKVTFEEQQQQITPKQKKDQNKEATENDSTTTNNVTKAATVGLITTATIALALLAGGSSSSSSG